MANKMLIDAAHPEETRVVVLRGSRVEEFDFESADKRQLRGNIYLAKVTRVEPSLQAAFIDYGGNRHGFLAFSEIHPDYYQIPVSDRQALLDAEAEEAAEEEEERRPKRSRRRRNDRQATARRDGDETVSEAAEDEHEQAQRAGNAHESTAEGDMSRSDVEEMRPVHREASEKPPYDDPTAELIQHASAVRQSEVPAYEAPADATPANEALAGTDDAPASHEPAPTALGFVAALEQPAVVAAQVSAQSDASGVEVMHLADAEATAATLAQTPSDADVDTGSSDEATESDDEETDERPARGGRRRHRGRSRDRDAHQEDRGNDEDENGDEEDEHVEHIGGDAMEEIPVRAYRPRRQYKIQEVIKRRQVLLVQVVKEERGNKGAALTTYLSLAGRYSVLMPNTARGGGISRKITDATDRQRLKSIAQELEVPDGMGVILRTAGAARTKPEVKRDFEYLMRMWETVRETTLGSSAPTLVYEEGSLIKRAIRDLYNKDVEEVVVAGEEGYREAKDFMRLLMPSHAKNVQPWRDAQPIFTKAGAEAQLDAMFSAQVTLKSGGYIVINQTEALVAIDVNSGRSTREHNIEDTALRTNLEAADEVARQLRLRDLAGLIVVDFIDMEEGRNNRAVERRIKDALKNDRARIQVGRISHFGLLEMSRQRIRTGVLEGSTVMCEHCMGSGSVRSTSSIALHVLRLIEDALILDASRNIIVRARSIVALYVLNQKRAHLADLEARFGATVSLIVDDHLTGTTYCGLDRGEPATGIPRPVTRQIPINVPDAADLADDEVAEGDGEREVEADAGAEAPREETSRPRGRRRRGRGRDREPSGITDDAPQPADDALGFMGEVRAEEQSGEARADVTQDRQDESGASDVHSEGEGRPGDNDEPEGGGRRRRSRRGGRRARESRERGERAEAHHASAEGNDEGEAGLQVDDPDALAVPDGGDAGELRLIGGEPVAPFEPSLGETVVQQMTAQHEPAAEHATAVEAAESEPAAAKTTAANEAVAEMPAMVAKPPVAVAETPAPDEALAEPAAPRRPEPVSTEADPARPKRSGWWQRAKATLGG